MQPKSQHVAAMWDYLADGQWHHQDDVLVEGGRAVMPGRAYRMSDAPKPTTEMGHATRVLSGQRALAGDGLRGLKRRGRVEVREGAHGPEVRRAP